MRGQLILNWPPKSADVVKMKSRRRERKISRQDTAKGESIRYTYSKVITGSTPTILSKEIAMKLTHSLFLSLPLSLAIDSHIYTSVGKRYESGARVYLNSVQ